jgi:hypothetical protein
VDDLIAVMQKAIEARDSLPEMGEQAYQKVVNQSPDAFGAQTNAIYIEK